MKKVRSLLRQWSMRFFVWHIEVKVKRLDGDDRILYLANLLMDEVQRHGYATNTTSPTYHSLHISHHETTGIFRVEHMPIGWKATGNRPA